MPRKTTMPPISLLLPVNEAYADLLYHKREEQWSHVPYEKELLILNQVKSGDVEALKDTLKAREELFPPHDEHLSENPLRQRKYELVAAVTMVSRWAVEGGLEVETAYSLADAYIQVGDNAKTQREIFSLHQTLPIDFAALVRDRKRNQTHSKPIIQCIDYIESNLHYPISLEDLAVHTSRSGAYLSVRFKQETGIALKDYIQRKRLEEAKRLLTHTELPVSDIAETLAFNSRSYFAVVFREHTGESPTQYRSRFFRTHQSLRS
jgi:AraC-like DNA-binding protein